MVFQPDCLDDLSYAIMYETTKLAYRVSEDDVTRARNQVCCYFDVYWFTVWLINVFIVQVIIGVTLFWHVSSVAYCIYSLHNKHMFNCIFKNLYPTYIYYFHGPVLEVFSVESVKFQILPMVSENKIHWSYDLVLPILMMKISDKWNQWWHLFCHWALRLWC